MDQPGVSDAGAGQLDHYTPGQRTGNRLDRGSQFLQLGGKICFCLGSAGTYF